MSSGMNLEEAKEYAETMSYKQAVSNCYHAKGIMYRKATIIKLRELAEIADRLVYCEECDYWQNRHLCKFWSKHGTIETVEDDFCSYGYQKGADDE